MRRLPFLLLSGIVLAFGCGSSTSEKEPLDKPTHTPLPPKKSGRKSFDLDQLTQNKGSVFVFLSPDCPLCQSYSPELKKLSSRYLRDSIRFYAIFPGKLYSEEEIGKFFKDYDIGMPYFTDEDRRLTDFLEATVTPEVFLVDKGGFVQYKGRIDNWAYDIGRKRPAATEHDLSDALEAFVHAKEIRVKETQAVGCIIEKAK
ncbi:MAG TPA: redoxin domain-containing protein [Bacteroidia bacterium]|jgi:thiol-disulfide isomerase/thioredoxin